MFKKAISAVLLAFFVSMMIKINIDERFIINSTQSF